MPARQAGLTQLGYSLANLDTSGLTIPGRLSKICRECISRKLAFVECLWSKHFMPKLYACCTDPKCRTYQAMILKLQVWGIDVTPKREGKRHYFEAAASDFWGKARRGAFNELVRLWPTEH